MRLTSSFMALALLSTPAIAEPSATDAGNAATRLERFPDASYPGRYVNDARIIQIRVEEVYGLPEEAARYTLSGTSFEVIIYFDPTDEQITYVNVEPDEFGEVKESLDDVTSGRLALAVLYDGDASSANLGEVTGYIIAFGSLPETDAILEDLSGFEFTTLSFIQNNEGGTTYVLPSNQVSAEVRSEHGFSEVARIEFGEDPGVVSVTRWIGPLGDFVEVTGRTVQDGYLVPMTYLLGRVTSTEAVSD